MVKGRVDKTVRQMCLMEAPFIKNLDQKVEQVVNAAIAKLGEKISVRRFVRCMLPLYGYQFPAVGQGQGLRKLRFRGCVRATGPWHDWKLHLGIGCLPEARVPPG